MIRLDINSNRQALLHLFLADGTNEMTHTTKSCIGDGEYNMMLNLYTDLLLQTHYNTYSSSN